MREVRRSLPAEARQAGAILAIATGSRLPKNSRLLSSGGQVFGEQVALVMTGKSYSDSRSAWMVRWERILVVNEGDDYEREN